MSEVIDTTAITVEVSPDGLEAALTLNSLPRDGFGYSDLVEALYAQGVTFGLQEAALRDLAVNPRTGQRIVVARGRKPSDSVEEQLVMKFKPGGEPHESEDGTGHVDFRELGVFNSFKAGDLLACRQCANEEAFGISVRGEQLPPLKCKPVKLSPGRGARLSEDGQCIIAEVPGHACLMNGKISVLESIEIRGDVDFSVGNIDFIGNVKIAGGVHPGFKVRAQGNLEIGGNVEKASIECGRELHIAGIVFGHGDCRISAGANASIGALDQAEVYVVGDLHVENYIRHCHILCGGSIELTGKKGNIVGGEISAHRNISAPNIGNPMATLTKLHVGSSPFAAGVVASHETELHEVQGKLDQVNVSINGILRRCGSNLSLLEPKLHEALVKLRQAASQYEQQIAALHAALAETRAQSADYHESRIRASDRVFPGVLMTFRGKFMYKTTDLAQFVSFAEQAGEIRMGPY